ncbi:hypothetical protein [Desulfatirhabdium butyrativorans]|uniref:hypothetical protein n=1 Tax=Desulfatirhabdium butyrativorans TaxID=340467 RepID=UPI00041EAFE8|nr:hypothetical protein [Desulfatirhabdium butyrativorans]
MEPALTRDILEHRWNRLLVCSEAAVRKHPEVLRDIKKHLDTVFSGPIDISQYYPFARKLTEMLNTLVQSHEETIFSYYIGHLDPGRHGDPRYFRAICLDLTQQIREMERWRMQRHRLRRIK